MSTIILVFSSSHFFGKFDTKVGAFHIFGLKGDLAVVILFDHAFDYVHADTRTGLVRRFGGKKRRKNLVMVLVLDADAVVVDLDNKFGRILSKL